MLKNPLGQHQLQQLQIDENKHNRSVWLQKEAGSSIFSVSPAMKPIPEVEK